jgi:hypothetical protein
MGLSCPQKKNPKKALETTIVKLGHRSINGLKKKVTFVHFQIPAIYENLSPVNIKVSSFFTIL